MGRDLPYVCCVLEERKINNEKSEFIFGTTY
jgi:hypothetical protein